MNDKLIMENYLLILKSDVEVFVHGTLESSNTQERELLKKGLNQILESQANTYNEMTKYGWYKVENVQNSEIQKTLKKVQNS